MTTDLTTRLPMRCNSTRPIGNRPQVANLPHMQTQFFMTFRGPKALCTAFVAGDCGCKPNFFADGEHDLHDGVDHCCGRSTAPGYP